MRIPLNNDWLYAVDEKMTKAQKVRLPHTNIVLPFNYTDDKACQFTSYYEKKLTVQQDWLAKSLILTFEGVAHRATVSVNGRECTYHNSGYTAFCVDIAPYVHQGDNTLTVRCESQESLNIPPFGNVIDYLTYGGIYREVYLEVKEKTYITDLFVKGYSVKEPYYLQEQGLAAVNLVVNVSACNAQHCQVEFTVTDGDGNAVMTQRTAVSNGEATLCTLVEGVTEWDIDNPALYYLTATLRANTANDESASEVGAVLDVKQTRFGFRTARFSQEGFFLNGKLVPLRGLNRHQSFPYVGYALPQRAQRRDAFICKNELCVNIVRTSHYPQSHHFIDACDELGLLVFTEIPGWQHIGDEAWRQQALVNVREMVTQYRNHPSIVCWGVRINESGDCDELYLQTNALCHSLDNSRATAGVRYIPKSHLLEDVYSYNDFNYNGNAAPVSRKNDVCPQDAPMLITEFNGHMYPTKSYDDEVHRTQQALRHLAVMNEYTKQPHLCGGIGWCMFDYNTHQEFGSGDKICHHGVMDMFRNAKLAAAAYSMQGDKPFMRVSSTFDKGEWAASNLEKVYVFTNADSVKLYRNGAEIGEYFPDRKNYAYLPHAPIVIDDFIGQQLMKNEGFSQSSSDAVKKCLCWVAHNGMSRLPLWIKANMAVIALREAISVKELVAIATRYAVAWGSGNNEFVVEGIYNGEVKLTRKFGSVNAVTLKIDADTLVLREGDTYDVASIRITAVDENGNVCPYFNEPLTLAATGAIKLLGDSIISLKGGMGGTYVKTTTTGEGTLNVECRGKKYQLRFTVQ